MYANLNQLMKSYNYKNKKESPNFIFNSKLSEINDISALFIDYKKIIYNHQLSLLINL